MVYVLFTNKIVLNTKHNIMLGKYNNVECFFSGCFN